MKATELMIGDWVIDKPLNLPLRITAECIFLLAENILNESNFEPIPLTEEILEENGLKNIFRGRYEYKDNGKFIIEVSMNKDKHEIMWIRLSTFYDDGFEDNVTCIKNIKYVHELQHALRLCGLNELADNFKIE